MSLHSSSRETAAASDWVRRHAVLIAPGGRVLDLACGSGRHARLLRDRGELLTLAAPLQVVAFEQGITRTPGTAVVQRICAVRASEPLDLPPGIPVAASGSLS